MPHNLFEGNTYKCILTGINVASTYKVTRPLRTKKSSEVAFVLEAIYKKGGVFKYRKTNIKNEVTKVLEKQNVEAFNIEFAKLLLKPMDAQELQDHEKLSTIWVKNLNKIVNKMNNTVSLMIGMNPKDPIKLDIVPLDKIYSEETVLHENGLHRYLY